MLSAPADFFRRRICCRILSSRSSIFNIGSFHRTGYNAGVKQMLGDHAEVSVTAGRAGVLTARRSESSYTDSGALRAGIGQAQRAWVTIRVAGTVPRAGTRIAANYGWTDFRVLMPAHLFVTQAGNQDIGVNLHISQPLPLIRDALADGSFGRLAQPAGARVSAFGRPGRTQRPHEFAAPACEAD